MNEAQISELSKDDLIDLLIRPILTEMLPFRKLNITDITILFGANGLLDSLAFVSFIIEVEFRFEEKYQTPLKLVTPHALAKKNSPFETVGRLADFIIEITQAPA